MLIVDFRMRREADLVPSFRAHQRDGTKPTGKKMRWPRSRLAFLQPARDIARRVVNCSTAEATQEIRVRIRRQGSSLAKVTAFPFPK